MKYLIQGLTSAGTVFRPSDWSERLCSALASYRTVGKLHCIDEARNHKMQGYSNCIYPIVVSGVKSVILDSALNEVEPLAFEFAMNFARDNNLTVVENYGEIVKQDLAVA